MKTLLLLLALTITAFAQTHSGTLKGFHGDTIRVQDANGSQWLGQLVPGCKIKTHGSLDSLKGRLLVFRVRGDLSASPRLVDLVGEVEDSARYQAQGPNVPYFTRKGDWALTGGVGGTPENGPNLPGQRNVGAYAPNGGMPHQNQP